MNNTRLPAALTSIEGLENAMEDLTDDQWPRAMGVLRRELRTMDEFRLFSSSYPIELQTRVLSIVQRFAYYDPNVGDISDISTWCLERWLLLLNGNSREVGVLRGLGEYWNLRGQQILHRIRANSSSSGDSSEADRGAPRAFLNRVHTQAHVEARGLLQPSADYYQRAVTLAQGNDTLDGDLLSEAAESHINIGSVTSGRESQGYFQRAIRYLRAASLFDDYELSEDLQRYLDDYGQYVD
ncbi:hypothetical protein BT63DRAFT_419894 [Microthyrium microscopicum]|uniref:Uncharacterized protein n=1 Tax=Microthyrium microscopicum TaxID=703497 RepID=A0A6A6US77_9PEZI|nr:hypothetical protein BT63DRAFT_419894 [Microthyrium microscopicum]